MTNLNKGRKDHQYVCISDNAHMSIPKLQEIVANKTGLGDVSMKQAVSWVIIQAVLDGTQYEN
jgi:hypothetical protein